jgi:hypothetical protein
MAKTNQQSIEQFLEWLGKAHDFYDENHPDEDEDIPRGCQTCNSDRGCQCDYMEDERTGN